ncbi:MAG: hypothetical protein RLZZ297_1970 [Chloroflexota bacterium]
MTQPALSRTVVILAAGDGTRMRSNLPKVLHPLAGRPMLSRIIDVAGSIDATQICIVVAPHSSAAISAACGAQHTYVPQRERRGTGHAVHTALPALHASDGDVVILFGDTPLIQPSTIAAVIADKTTHGATLSLLSFDVPAPHNYGRIVRDAAGTVTAIVEAKNCTPAQALIREANSGIMVASLGWVRSALPRVTPNPLTNEYYLTDLVALAVADHGSGAVRAVSASDPDDAWGVNDRAQLAAAEAILHQRTIAALLQAGVSIPHPGQVAIAPEVHIAADTTILPGCVLTGATEIGAGCVIGPQTTIDECRVGAGCTIPHSYLKHSTIAADQHCAPYTVIVDGGRS